MDYYDPAYTRLRKHPAFTDHPEVWPPETKTYDALENVYLILDLEEEGEIPEPHNIAEDSFGGYLLEGDTDESSIIFYALEDGSYKIEGWLGEQDVEIENEKIEVPYILALLNNL